MLGVTRLDDHGVAVVDVGIDHRIAADAEGEGLRRTATGAGRNRHLHRREHARGFRVVGQTGGDRTGELHFFEVHDLIVARAFVADDGLGQVGADLGGDLVGAGGARDALEDALALEGLEVAEDGVRAGEAELGLDVADARPIGELGDMLAHVVEDGLLLLGECFHGERMFLKLCSPVNNSMKGPKGCLLALQRTFAYPI